MCASCLLLGLAVSVGLVSAANIASDVRQHARATKAANAASTRYAGSGGLRRITG